MTRSQSKILRNKFSNISTNQQVQITAPAVNYVLSPIERNTNPGYPQGTKIYLQAKKEIEKEADKLDISV